MDNKTDKEKNYTHVNSSFFDKWISEGWEWGLPVSHDILEKAKQGDWSVLLSPCKSVPKEWFCDFKGAKILGLASGGAQQMPVFSVLGAQCTVMDYSKAQLESERMVSQREGYEINIVNADMTKPFPFEDNSFDLIFHPVSNSYIKDVLFVWKECYRVLKKGGILLSGFDNGINYVFDEDETHIESSLPFDPLADEALYDYCIENDWGIQFSHPIEEQIGGQLKAGFTLTDIFEDTNNVGNLHDHNVPVFYVTRSVKL